MDKTGVLLLNFGAPESLAEVEDFVVHILQGQKPPDHLLKLTKEKYEHIGGGSPLNSVTSAQAERLAETLKKQGKNYPVYYGMLHSKPFISQVIGEMVQDGIKRIFAISLAPFDTKVSTGAYYARVEETVRDLSCDVTVLYKGEWSSHASFHNLWAEKVINALKDDDAPGEVNLIFTAHSLPLEPMGDAGRYERQFQETVKAVQSKLPHSKVYFAYQSKGKKPGSWLGPQVEEVIAKLSLEGEERALAVPIGFVSDHLETLYDLDVAAKKHAETMKMKFHRTSALNDDPAFINFLAELVGEMDLR